MTELQTILKDVLIGAEFLSALVGVVYFFKLKKSYWKWFSVYLVVIVLQEIFWRTTDSVYYFSSVEYYVFFGVPFQFIFLYWLYGLKSLRSKKLFLLCTLAYVFTIGIITNFEELSEVFSLSTSVGIIILMLLVVLEFKKQIRNDDILNFRYNKMFYINTAVIIFYVGIFPLYMFGKELSIEYPRIINIYYIYFSLANCIMYLLFAASFIWGKEES